MPISKARLKHYFDDYAEVTGKRLDRFVCPITLRECELAELVEGHILNKEIKRASRKKVVQYRPVDNFYGKEVEPDLIRYLNMRQTNKVDFFTRGRDLKVTLTDGAKV